MLATLRTIMWSTDSASTNAARSAAMRSTAWRAVRGGLASPQCPSLAIALPAPKWVPGRTRAVAAASSSWHAVIQSASKTPEFAPKFLGRFRERRLADIVAADHEIAGLGQRQAVENGQLGHQPRAIGQPAGHRRQPQSDRRADPSKRTD